MWTRVQTHAVPGSAEFSVREASLQTQDGLHVVGPENQEQRPGLAPGHLHPSCTLAPNPSS